MNIRKAIAVFGSIGVVAVIAALSVVLVPKASAAITDEETILTFNQPVEIPGMVLPAGTYVFKVADYANGDRSVIQVLDKNETHVYGTFLTRPVVRLDRGPLITFAERPAGSPLAIAALFPYETDLSGTEVSGTTGSFSWIPNDGTRGHAFVYPKNERAPVLAAAKR